MVSTNSKKRAPVSHAHPLLKRARLRLPERTSSMGDSLPLCKLCDLADWSHASFTSIAADIMGGSAPHHRKLWEFTQLIRALKSQNLLSSDSIGLSVAAGNERVLYYLANRVARVVATDLYGDGAFASREASQATLEDPSQFAPYPYRREALATLYMDGCALKFLDNTFDFAFCLSSLEHFGGFRQSQACIKEMTRVVRPGGLVFFTTECSLNGFVTDQVFKPASISALLSGVELNLLDSISWELSDETLGNLTDMRGGDLSKLPHINLRDLSTVFTSISIAACKSGSVARSVSVGEIDRLVTALKREPIQRIVPKPLTLFEWVLRKLEQIKWRIEAVFLIRGAR